jgi:integrase
MVTNRLQNMTRTKFTGVYYRDNLQKDRVYYIQYKQAGKLKRQKVGTKAEGITAPYCKKLRDEILVKLRLGESSPIKGNKKVKTLSEISKEFFERDDLRTKSRMQSLYNTHLKHLANEPLNYFDDNNILTLTVKKKKETSIKTKRILSNQTINNILTLLSSMLHFAKRKGYTKVLPTIKKLKTDNKRERYLSGKEISSLYNEIQTSELVRKKDRLLLFVKLSLITGARLGSILGIKGKDINRTNKTIAIKNFKTNNTYTAFIPDDVLALIPTLKPQEYLIDVADSKQIQRPLQRILNKLFNDGLKPEDRKERVVIHTLRHTFASHLAINGTPIQTIMKLMDHKDIEMTLRYSKLMPDSGRTDVENLYE